ncbi:hypothetical protein DD238_004016 [Peronospora effusa]|uniref:Uncharacterized protein n=1 Tax=Peronospora effusa TaxID=542832 RepID=A0A3M6VI17_9STRA|nr:hypothetical protein DD238_004016 [Peronospora effusa]
MKFAENILAEFTCMYLTSQGFCNAFRCEDLGEVVTPEGGTAQGRGVSGVARLKSRAKDR